MACEENGALRGLSPRKNRSTKQVARSGPPQGGLAQKRHDGVDRSSHSTTMLLTPSWSWRFSPQATARGLMGPDPREREAIGTVWLASRSKRQCRYSRVPYDVGMAAISQIGREHV